MSELLGGTTGQVLSKTSNTNMDFTWVTTDDANAIQNSIVNAKGDLIGASANDVPAILSVGNNGETLVADSSTSTGLRYQSGYNGNAIINGGMDIWQRGTSITNSASVQYSADRWLNWMNGTVGVTVSRQTTSDTTNLPTIQYCARVQRNSGQTGTSAIVLEYAAETADSIRFTGQTVTLSFYARAGSNFSATSNALTVNLTTGTGTDQQLKNFTGQSNIVSTTATLTTTWQRFTYSATVGTTATEIGCQFYFTPTGTASTNDFFEITGVQLELGSRATTFKRSNGSGGTIQGELSACQRYYYRNTPGTSYGVHGNGYSSSATNVYAQISLPVQMRINPVLAEYANIAFQSSNGSINAFTVLAGDQYSPTIVSLAGTGTFTSQLPGRILNNNNTAGYIGLSAEL
jgi:hypothetical protein